MPKFDENIKSAIEKAVEREGSQFALCKKTGISTSIMSRYLKDDVKTINAGTWNMIYPVIKDYLPEEYHRTFLRWKSQDGWDEYAKKYPETYNTILGEIENLDIKKIAKTDPLFGRSDEFINTIKLITEKLPLLSQKTLNKFLIEAIKEIEAAVKE